MNFALEYEKRKTEFEGYLKQFVHELVSYPEELITAVSYSLLGSGKRLRPVIFLEAVRMFGGKTDMSAVNLAIAIECIHTYSLIHDDLPCMDNDELRRGKPTCHVKFGEANALLAGDALLNLAYELILGAIALGDNADKFVKAGGVIAAAAGGNGMVGGQVCDLKPNVSENMINYIYEHKTGALIRAALCAGATVGGATQSEIEKIVEFGNNFGFAFQLCDDLLDKDDEDADKKTYVSLYGEESTREMLKAKTVAALSALENIDNSEFFVSLTTNFMERQQ